MKNLLNGASSCGFTIYNSERNCQIYIIYNYLD